MCGSAGEEVSVGQSEGSREGWKKGAARRGFTGKGKVLKAG